MSFKVTGEPRCTALRTGRLAAVLAGATLAVTAAGATASATTGGSVYAGPKSTALQHTNTVAPGDWLSLGWAVQISGPNHPAAQVDLQGITVTLPLACSQNGGATTVTWSFADESVTVPSGYHDWFPTNQNNVQAAYQLHARAPDLCSGGPMYVGAGDRNGAALSATVYSSDTVDSIAVEFHSGDIYTGKSKPPSNIDCSSSQNPGDGTCGSPWTPNTPSDQTTASPLSAEPQPTPASSGGVSGGSGGNPGGPGGPGGSSGGSSGGPSGGAGPLPVVGGGSSLSPLPVSGGGTQATSTAPGLPQASPTPRVIAVAPTPRAHPSPPVSNFVLGPVPVLAPVVGDAIAKLGAAVPWNWFLVLAAIDALLLLVVALRRRARRAAG